MRQAYVCVHQVAYALLKPLDTHSSDCRCCRLVYGIYRSPGHWLRAAHELQFPMDLVPWAREWQAKLLCRMSSAEPMVVVRERASFVRNLIKLRSELVEDELIDLSFFDAGACCEGYGPLQLMDGKHVWVFERLMEPCCISDRFVSDGLRRGFPISGSIPRGPLFPENHGEKVCLSKDVMWVGAAECVDEALSQCTDIHDLHHTIVD
eukprot:1327092-Amphidinium_carterae.1